MTEAEVASDSDPRQHRTRLVAAFLAGCLVAGVASGWWLTRPQRRVAIHYFITVTTAVDNDATAIGVESAPAPFFGRGFDVSGAEGRECLTPLENGQMLRIGAVHLKDERGGGRDVVVSIECLP